MFEVPLAGGEEGAFEADEDGAAWVAVLEFGVVGEIVAAGIGKDAAHVGEEVGG